MKPFMVPILVAMELASFIFSEVECENRTYQTWWAQVSEWFKRAMGLSGLVSDGAKALVKLALVVGMSQSARYVPSPVCLEQIHRQCNCPSTGATAKTAPRLTRETQNASPAAISEVSAQITVLQAQQDKLEIDRQDYQQNLHACPKLFTFDLNTGNLNLGSSYPLGCSPFWLMWSGWVKPMPDCGCSNRCLATTDTTPIRDNSCLVAGYPSSLFPNPRPGYTTLGAHNSPALGLLASTNRKTRHTELKQGYHQATQQAHVRFLAHSSHTRH